MATQNPKLSILIVSYNTRDRLRECLNSIGEQSIADQVETLVVDNASKDGSSDMVANEFPQTRLFVSDTNLGFGNGNNRAFNEARGRYIVLLNSDAMLAPDLLEKALELMESTATVGMGGARLIAPDGGWQPSARSFPSILNEFLNLSGLSCRFPKSRLFGRFDRTWADPLEPAMVDWVPGAFAIIRRSVLEEVGFFDPCYFLYYEEVDLCRRIRKAGYQICYWPELVVTHIGGASSETVESLSMSSFGAQLTLWRMRSQLLYYRKWHGRLNTMCVKLLEQLWHGIRAWKNRGIDSDKKNESKVLIALWEQAWEETRGGLVSPVQPW